ncbi:hypothetical protein MBLNU230_g4378t2 [Neophaeotheca triangularis]
MSCHRPRALPLLSLITVLLITLSAAFPVEDHEQDKAPEPTQLARFKPHHVLLPVHDSGVVYELTESWELSGPHFTQIWTQAITVYAQGSTHHSTKTGYQPWQGAAPCFINNGKLFTEVPITTAPKPAKDKTTAVPVSSPEGTPTTVPDENLTSVPTDVAESTPITVPDVDLMSVPTSPLQPTSEDVPIDTVEATPTTAPDVDAPSVPISTLEPTTETVPTEDAGETFTTVPDVEVTSVPAPTLQPTIDVAPTDTVETTPTIVPGQSVTSLPTSSLQPTSEAVPNVPTAVPGEDLTSLTTSTIETVSEALPTDTIEATPTTAPDADLPPQPTSEVVSDVPTAVPEEDLASLTTSAIETLSEALPTETVEATPITTPDVDLPAVPTSPLQSTDSAQPTPTTAPDADLPPQTTSEAVPVVPSTVPDDDLTSLTTSAIQTASEAVPTVTSGSIQTSLQTSGNPSELPFPTSMIESATSLSLVDLSTLESIQPSTTAVTAEFIGASDIFEPLATGAPPSQIASRADHPAPRLGIQPQEDPLQTNKFYSNFFLGGQTVPTFTFPYSVTWVNGAGRLESFGMAISHTERDQLATGAINDQGAWSFYANPLGIQPLILSATELGTGTTLTTDSLLALSVNVNLIATGQTTPTITFPLLQGMGFVTALYNDGTPLVESGVGIGSITYVGAIGDLTHKYRFTLLDGNTWLLYVTPEDGDYNVTSFTLVDSNTVQGPSGFNGVLQVAKIPQEATDAGAIYDDAAGAYATSASVSGSTSGTTGQYSLTWTNSGVQSQNLLMWALPHHVESFDAATLEQITDMQLVSPTKGFMTAVNGASWTFSETDLPVTMGFAPWTPTQGPIPELSEQARDAIDSAGMSELEQNLMEQTDLDSMYYSGKALAKFAGIVYALNDLSENRTLALTGLQRLQDAFAMFVENRQQFPLVYDSAWGGAVSSASYVTGNSGVDFGNSYYNGKNPILDVEATHQLTLNL